MPRIRAAEREYGIITSHVRPSPDEIKARRLCATHGARLTRQGKLWRVVGGGVDLLVTDPAAICPSDFSQRR